MPSSKVHLAAAEHNQELVRLLLPKSEFSDWLAVVAFYTALHLVEAVLFEDGIKHGGNHRNREQILKRKKRYDQLYKHYIPLKEASVVARYLDRYDTFSKYMSPSEVQTELVDHSLKRIEQSANGLLKSPRRQ